MRILNVRFRNLNSLVGEWEIDLTHPAFTTEGFFAITGPTGAGKSTILDAICLAIYGKTPRLDKITQSSNEVMSRQTGECFAEVTFETQAGKFRSHWSQHRARKNPGGELQAPKHEISDAVTNQVLETRQASVAEKILAVTGMNYGQFTKSMLLAQGDFAIFLQAKSDERAPILEQITGTGIYSRISICAHERYSEEKRQCELLEAELAGLQLLSGEDELQLKLSLAYRTTQETALEAKIDENSRAVSWLDGIADLENQLLAIGEQRRDLASRTESFLPDRQRLERAVKALELAADHASLAAIRTGQETDFADLEGVENRAPELEAAARLCCTAVEQKSMDLAQWRDRQKCEIPVFKKVRELDTQLNELEPVTLVVTDAVSKLNAEIKCVSAKAAEDQKALEGDLSNHESASSYIAKNAADASLVEHLAAIRSRFEFLKSAHEIARNSALSLVAAESRTYEACISQQRQRPIVQSLKDAAESTVGTLSRLRADVMTTLRGRELPAWRSAQLRHSNDVTGLNEIEIQLAVREKARRAEGASKSREVEMTRTIEGIAKDVAQGIEAAETCKRHVGLLSIQLELRRRVRDLEDERTKLTDGVPCALCGSTEHPYALGDTPSLDETESEMEAATQDLDQANEKLTQLRLAQTENQCNLDQTKKDQGDSRARVADANTRVTEIAVTLDIKTKAFDLPGSLDRLKVEVAAGLAETASVVQEVENLEKEIERVRASLDSAKDEQVHSEKVLQEIDTEADTAGRELTRLTEESTVHTAKLQRLTQLLLVDIKPYGVHELRPGEWDGILLGLTERLSRWQQQQDLANKLETRVKTLEQQLQHDEDDLTRIVADRAGRQAELVVLIQKRDKLKHERITAFGEKDPDVEDGCLVSAIELAETELETAKISLNVATQEVANVSSRIMNLKESVEERAGRLQDSEASFALRRIACEFFEEIDYLEASLPADERAELAKQAGELTKENNDVETRAKDRADRLCSEQKLQLTDKSREVLTQEGKDLAVQKKNIVQEIGATNQRLFDNDSQRINQRQQIEAVQAQKREAVRWEMLSKLIGSADGKKYRNFVQGVTFEMMIRHANRQLQKMTDRYLLIKNDNQPLELNVIDNYQAGEIRSSKNLSGGESFIVSLALALGLSHMASRNVRVDSLFLDEGFGTLDEDALDIALNTLAGLQQDGKLIGVISHVSALKERITTQIQITPQSGGRSKIVGPGCQRVIKEAVRLS